MKEHPVLPCLAIVLVGFTLLSCQKRIDSQPEPQPATSQNGTAPNTLGQVNSAGIDTNTDAARSGKDKCLVPGPFEPYFAGEEAFVFKSTPSTTLPYYDPKVCDSAPFVPTLSAGGRMTSVLYRLEDAELGNPEKVEVGYGTLCFKVQDPKFTPFGPPMLVYGALKVNGKALTVSGNCTVTNAAMPTTGVAQMSCALPLIAPIPAGYVGGLLTANSVMNMAAVPNLSSGSILALHMYKASASQPSPPTSVVPSAGPAKPNPQ
jgi:hypothetical protein